jgi:hypothetical protein
MTGCDRPRDAGCFEKFVVDGLERAGLDGVFQAGLNM